MKKGQLKKYKAILGLIGTLSMIGCNSISNENTINQEETIEENDYNQDEPIYYIDDFDRVHMITEVPTTLEVEKRTLLIGPYGLMEYDENEEYDYDVYSYEDSVINDTISSFDYLITYNLISKLDNEEPVIVHCTLNRYFAPEDAYIIETGIKEHPYFCYYDEIIEGYHIDLNDQYELKLSL